ncbi:MFS transporter [Auraticoccus sp. F435]|uniref:MFS transporter n=1 Tax=Auraticoccus cholistanensis TaxID=2656650 RepID=A0A6A9UT46_9ACTN|nr:MFS transporter [Auraticoccus cholistanensis]MVA75808.1 MFS transporter [Auraticoccus cholistanensis]
MSVLIDLSPLRASAAFRRLWWGLGISNLGSQLTVVVVGLQVYDITGSTLSVGVLGLCALVPLVLLGLYGGALVDRYDRRRVALLASAALWLTSIAFAVQGWLGHQDVELLYVLVAVQSACSAVNNPARSAIIPRLVPVAMLPAAHVLQTVTWNVALTVGPLAGAGLVALAGFGAAYTVDAVLFTAALYALWRLPDLPPQQAGTDAATAPRRSGLASVLEGLSYLATRPNVRMTFVVDLIAMVLAMPRVLFPAVGVLYLGGGAGTTGLLTAAFAVGAVLAGLLSGNLVGVNQQGRVITAAVAAFGACVAGFGLVLLLVGPDRPQQPVLWALLACLLLLAAAGAADAISSVFRQSILQAATPDSMRGRLQGVFIVVVAGGPRLGDLTLGAAARWVDEAGAALVGGLLCAVAVVLVTRLQARFLDYDARDPRP